MPKIADSVPLQFIIKTSSYSNISCLKLASPSVTNI